MNSDYNYIFYDFEVKILIRTSTFGGVTLKVLSNSKHTLLCLCGHNVLEILLQYNKVQISSVYPQFASSDSIRCKRLWRYATLFCNSCPFPAYIAMFVIVKQLFLGECEKS